MKNPLTIKSNLLAALISSTLLLISCSTSPEKGSLLSNTLCTVSVGDCTNPAVKEQDDPIVRILTGKPTTFIIDRLGLPNRRSELASGSKTWIYFDHMKGLNAKECQVSLSIRNKVVERVNISTSNKSLFSFLSKGCQRIRKEVI